MLSQTRGTLYGDNLQNKLGKARVILVSKNYPGFIRVYTLLVKETKKISLIKIIIRDIESILGMGIYAEIPISVIENIYGLKTILQERLRPRIKFQANLSTSSEESGEDSEFETCSKDLTYKSIDLKYRG